jgi:nucleobase:cation symporter-1, NCS1 family
MGEVTTRRPTSALVGEGPTSGKGVLGQIETRSIDWITPKERHGNAKEQSALWFMGNFQIFSITTGFLGVQLGLSLGWAIVSGALGILFGTLFMAFHATQGPVFGLPQMIQSRAQFGYRGVVIPLFGAFFTFMAFNVADQILLSSGLNGTFGWNVEVVAVLVTVMGAVVAIFGHDWVHRVFRWLLIIAFPLVSIISIAVLFGQAGGTKPEAPGGFVFSVFMIQFTVAAAYNISYAPYVSDYSRYLPKNTPARPIIAAVFCGASASAIWLIALGAWMASRLGATDSLVGLQVAGNNVFDRLGSVAAFLSAIILVTTMGMNAYGAMLSVVTAVDSVKSIQPSRQWRVITLVVLAVVWYVVAKWVSLDAVATVFSSLTLMLYLLVPWTAINLVDFFFVRRGHYAVTHLFRPDGVYGAWGVPGLAAFAIGFIAEIPFMVIPPNDFANYTGWAAKNWADGVDYAWLVGLIVSGAAFLVLSRNVNHAAEQVAIAESDIELERLGALS